MIQKILKALIMLLFGAAIGYAGVRLGMYLGNSDTGAHLGPKWAALLLAFLGVWLALAWHEAGHLFAGLWQGFRFELYIAGFLGARRHPQTSKVQWFFNKDPKLFGGVAATLPVVESPDLVKRFAGVVAAGPLSSLLLALLAAGLGFLLSPALPLVSFFFSITAFISAGLFLATTIPSRTGPFFTDRARYFRLMGGGEAAEVERQMLSLTAWVYSGKSLEMLKDSDLSLVLLDKDYGTTARFFLYFAHLQAGRNLEAAAEAKQLAAISKDMPVTFALEFWKESFFSAAVLDPNINLARIWWDKVHIKVNNGKDISSLRLQAAWEMVNGRDASDLLQKMKEQLDSKTRLDAFEQAQQAWLLRTMA